MIPTQNPGRTIPTEKNCGRTYLPLKRLWSICEDLWHNVLYFLLLSRPRRPIHPVQLGGLLLTFVFSSLHTALWKLRLALIPTAGVIDLSKL